MIVGDTFARALGAIGTVAGIGASIVAFMAYRRDRPKLVLNLACLRRYEGTFIATMLTHCRHSAIATGRVRSPNTREPAQKAGPRGSPLTDSNR